ncbi:MAG: 50S ribosomal protein L25 [Nitrospirae bacterium]|nr:50S ribosomal protein L25 [Nitrospirota bacterium]
MEQVTLKAEKRMEAGKGVARTLRRQEMLPAVLYGGGSSIPIRVHLKDIDKLMSSQATEHALISMELIDENAKKTNHWVLVKDYQVDPINDDPLHIDFIEISLEKKIKVTVPIAITKEPAGVKKGGIMQQLMREVQVECLPTEIPERIEVNAEALEIGHSLHVSDFILKEGLKILTDPQAVVLTVTAPLAEEVAPAEAVVAEPELVKKTKAKEKEEEIATEKEKPKKEQKEQKTQKEKG